jgi:uncharacterized DUF497 family protein
MLVSDSEFSEAKSRANAAKHGISARRARREEVAADERDGP